MICVEEDLKTMEIRNWKGMSGNSGEWCRIIEEAHKGLVIDSWVDLQDGLMMAEVVVVVDSLTVSVVGYFYFSVLLF